MYKYLKNIVFNQAAWFFVIFLSVTMISCTTNNYSVTNYGAVADGVTLNTLAIQQAIDEASQNGGGRVIVPAGQFLTGAIELKSNVELYLEKGARLLGSTNRLDYGSDTALAFIYSHNQTNISLCGQGIIDGQGAEVVKDLYKKLRAGTLTDNKWTVKRPRESSRPELLAFELCENVKVSGVTLKNSAAWVLTFRNSTQIKVDSVTIESTEYWNNDGIDVVNCQNVHISSCKVDCADDAICLKSEGAIEGICENITVENCTLRSSASGFKLGTGSHGGFKNIKVRNLTIFDTYRSAVAIECVDGGFLEDVDIRNITARHTGNGFVIRLGHRNQKKPAGTLRNVHIENLYAEIPSGKPDVGYPMEGPRQKYPHNVFPASITGIPGHNVENVSIKNIELVYEGGGNKETAYFDWKNLDEVTENEAGYPEFSMFGELPVWALYVRHVSGLTLQNITLTKHNTDYRPAIAFNDVEALKIDSLTLKNADVLPNIIVKDVSSFEYKNLLLPSDNQNEIYLWK